MFDVAVNFDRWKAVDFAYLHKIAPITFITTLPKGIKNANYLHQVFDYNIWLLLFLTIIIIYFFQII